ncbi:PadR family transcriptional regulator [Geodermatophilus sp. YIM 151500]|uniref:PadR family transcriptional regulator n=1 Tax=Geodermatophilus sp. YIM 151500 TaxID=2984531 RepID=UPI0021E44564|nr:PadR family transcriptional regulator [Geodermatophilus sp. YIM 151500]MCV2487955.1 PadR family transcriptional regulator [Geodermatophilus sp. YIM 151500]
MSRAGLSTTSFAILGLLAVRPWSTYELTRQMDRSLGRLWPRARSKLYEEPRKLVEAGLAVARAEYVGRRPRTVYEITPQGRAALAEWLARPGAGPVLEFEQLLKVWFAEHGTRQDALENIAAARRWAEERNEENQRAARAYLAGEGPFQARAAQTMLVGAFLTDFYALVARWADWAAAVVEDWPEDPARATPDRAALEDIVRRADW